MGRARAKIFDPTQKTGWIRANTTAQPEPDHVSGWAQAKKSGPMVGPGWVQAKQKIQSSFDPTRTQPDPINEQIYVTYNCTCYLFFSSTFELHACSPTIETIL